MEEALIFLDSHVHMVSRTTDDYEAMKKAGVVAVIEPAFWQGQPRTEVGTFKDYLSMLIGFERFRASQFGIKHYCTIGLNAKEANNEALAEQVMELLPLYLCKDGVVGVGEIGYDDQTDAEDKYFRLQLELAKELNLPIQIHTPHRDKKAGTTRTMDVIIEHGIDPTMVIVDHNNEETCKEVLDRGFWAAFTIYPHTKMGNERMVEVLRQYGPERIIIDSAADWGISDPLAVPKTAALILQSGLPAEYVTLTCYKNPLDAYSKSGQISESDWQEATSIDQTQLFEGNSILRGGQSPQLENGNASNIIK